MQLSYFIFQALCLPTFVSAASLRSPVHRHESYRSSVSGAEQLLQTLPLHSSFGNGQATAAPSQDKKANYEPLYFGLMIDAGSSGTRVRMFKWTLRNKVDLVEVMPIADEEDLFEVHPGLSAYADDPDAALPPLAAILKAAQRYVPKAAWEKSLLFLKATAGMRLLERKKAKRLMDKVREFLSDAGNCPFKFVSAEIISGEEEALFSFITTNYNLGTLSKPTKMAGALELGGASMQVVFKPSSDIQDNEFEFYLDGNRESVYAKSYLRFGIDEAMARSLAILTQRSAGKAEVESPCHNQGFKGNLSIGSGKTQSFVGTGNSSSCTDVIRKVMGLDIECLMPPCAIFGSYMAPVEGDFFAFAGYFFAANGIGLVGWKDAKALTLGEVADATARYCNKDMQTAQQDSGQPLKYAQNYCFMGNYIHESLSVFGFKESKSRVTFSRKLSGFNLGWPSGAMLYETHLMPLSLAPHEGIRGLCGPPQELGTPPDGRGGADRPQLGVFALGVAFYMMVFLY